MKRGRDFRANHVLVTLLLVSGCADTGTEGCRTKEDCALGEVCVSGRCRPDGAGDSGTPDAFVEPDSGLMDASEPDASQTDGHVGCQITDDYVVQRSELVFLVGLGATFKVNSTAPVSVDLMGDSSSGETVWDYSQATPSDRSVVDELLAVEGNWYASDFPNATYATLLDEGLDTIAIFQVTETELLLLGIVSSEAQKTLLTYDPPVTMMSFPVELGGSHISESTVSGTFNWVWFAADETYDVTADAVGTVVVPAGSFHVVRTRTNYTQHIQATMLWTTRVIYTYLTECFGVVARVTSQDNETENIFGEAEELRRMTL